MTPAADRPDAPRIDGQATLPGLFLQRCRQWPARTAHREKRLGIWQSHSWRDYLAAAREIGLGLAELGLTRGGVVTILAEDCRDWLCADLGVQCVGGITCGAYTTATAERLAEQLRHSGSGFLFVGDDEALDRFLEIRARVPAVRKCIVMRRDGLHGFSDPQVLFLDELRALGAALHRREPDRFRRAAAAVRPADIATLIYTSGTTGAPRGAMVSQANLLAGIKAALPALSTRPGDEQLCFLPLGHVLERMVSAYVPVAAGSVVNFAESPATVFANLHEIAPDLVVAVPRVWERIQSGITLAAAEAGAVGRWACQRALACGHEAACRRLQDRRLPPALALRHRFWDWLVLARLRRRIGLGRARRAISGAAPVAGDLLRWYRAIGVPIYEGYGLTESTGVVTVNGPAADRVGSVGRAAPGVEVRTAADGEILVRGGLVFCGYWQDAAATDRTLAAGWLHTGDLGRIDADGFVWITGRSKDIVITAGGRNIAPAPLENQLKLSPYIADAVVIGDRRRFLTALLMIDQENVERFARRQRIAHAGFASLCRAAPVLALLQREVATANAGFSAPEQLRDFRVIDRQLTAGDAELTPTMKLRRAQVEATYGPLIEEMYAAGRG